MKAMLWTGYGPPDVLQLGEVEKPNPKEDEVLVKVHATTVTAGDNQIRSLKGPALLMLPMRMYVGFSKPQKITILGQELAGEIEAVGKRVSRFSAGDQVFAWTGLKLGAYAEYICVPENGVMDLKPSNLTYEEAAVLPVGGLEAVHFIKKANIRSGDKVLINGAGGSIGTFAVQLARYFGASVIAVDSAGKLEMLRSIGAGQVVDYEKEDFTRRGETYDVIFDVIGTSPFSRSLGVLNQNGRYCLGNPGLAQMVFARWMPMGGGKKVLLWEASRRPEDLTFLIGLVESGKVKPVIDKIYPLEQAAEAHRYVETGQKKGNVVISVISNQ